MGDLNIRFRPMHVGDFEQIAEWLSDEEDIAMFDRGLPLPLGKGFIEESWKSAVEYSDPPKAIWFILETEQAEPIGMCGVQGINYIHGDGVIPLFVSRGYRQKGLGNVMLLYLINLAFGKLRLHRLSTVFRSDNKASRTLVESAGFQVEGLAREAWYGDGQYQDIIHVGLLSREWETVKSSMEKRVAASSFNVVRSAENAE